MWCAIVAVLHGGHDDELELNAEGEWILVEVGFCLWILWLRGDLELELLWVRVQGGTIQEGCGIREFIAGDVVR